MASSSSGISNGPIVRDYKHGTNDASHFSKTSILINPPAFQSLDDSMLFDAELPSQRLYCDICNFSAEKEQFRIHLCSAAHQAREKQVHQLQERLAKPTVIPGCNDAVITYNCEQCQMGFETETLLNKHLDSLTHLLSVQKDQGMSDDLFAEPCEENFENMNTDAVGDEDPETTEYICGICMTTCPGRNALATHLQSEEHAKCIARSLFEEPSRAENHRHRYRGRRGYRGGYSNRAIINDVANSGSYNFGRGKKFWYPGVHIPGLETPPVVPVVAPNGEVIPMVPLLPPDKLPSFFNEKAKRERTDVNLPPLPKDFYAAPKDGIYRRRPFIDHDADVAAETLRLQQEGALPQLPADELAMVKGEPVDHPAFTPIDSMAMETDNVFSQIKVEKQPPLPANAGAGDLIQNFDSYWKPGPNIVSNPPVDPRPRARVVVDIPKPVASGPPVPLHDLNDVIVKHEPIDHWQRNCASKTPEPKVPPLRLRRIDLASTNRIPTRPSPAPQPPINCKPPSRRFGPRHNEQTSEKLMNLQTHSVTKKVYDYGHGSGHSSLLKFNPVKEEPVETFVPPSSFATWAPPEPFCNQTNDSVDFENPLPNPVAETGSPAFASQPDTMIQIALQTSLPPDDTESADEMEGETQFILDEDVPISAPSNQNDLASGAMADDDLGYGEVDFELDGGPDTYIDTEPAKSYPELPVVATDSAISSFNSGPVIVIDDEEEQLLLGAKSDFAEIADVDEDALLSM